MYLKKETRELLETPFVSEHPVECIEMRHQYWGPDGIVWSPWYRTSKDTPRKPYQGTFKNLKNEYRNIN